MKYILLMAVIGVSISACTERPADQAASKPMESAIVYVKPDETKPATIPAALTATTTCSFDGLNGGAREVQNLISDKSKIRLVGWAANTAGVSVSGDVFLELDGAVKLYAKVIRGSVKRPDVAEAYKNPALVDSSWEVNLDMSGVAPGKYKIRIIGVNGQASAICDPNGFLIIS